MKCLPTVLLYSLINQSILAFLVISFSPASFSLRVSCALSLQGKAAAGGLKSQVVEQGTLLFLALNQLNGLTFLAFSSCPISIAASSDELLGWSRVGGSFCLSVLAQGLSLHGPAHGGEHQSTPLPSHRMCWGGQSLAAHPYRAAGFALLFFEVSN